MWSLQKRISEPIELGLDAAELLDQEVAVVLGVEIAQVLAHGVQAHHSKLPPIKTSIN